MARHDQFSGHRVSITPVTSSWSDGTAGPLGLCIPRAMMSDAEVEEKVEQPSLRSRSFHCARP